MDDHETPVVYEAGAAPDGAQDEGFGGERPDYDTIATIPTFLRRSLRVVPRSVADRDVEAEGEADSHDSFVERLADLEECWLAAQESLTGGAERLSLRDKMIFTMGYLSGEKSCG